MKKLENLQAIGAPPDRFASGEWGLVPKTQAAKPLEICQSNPAKIPSLYYFMRTPRRW